MNTHRLQVMAYSYADRMSIAFIRGNRTFEIWGIPGTNSVRFAICDRGKETLVVEAKGKLNHSGDIFKLFNRFLEEPEDE